jgi:hypothetical protein
MSGSSAYSESPGQGTETLWTEAVTDGTQFEIGRWASAPLPPDINQTFGALELGFRVGMIATFRPELVCCAADQLLNDVLSDPTLGQFDHLPVVRSNTSPVIVGVLDRTTANSGMNSTALVAAVMRPRGTRCKVVQSEGSPSLRLPGTATVRPASCSRSFA